jgi:apoptosis-inducing factor 3
VILDGGKETIKYDKLILATGGVPKRLPVPGSDLQNVYTFRTVEDAKTIDAGTQSSRLMIGRPGWFLRVPSVAKEGKRLIVIGSSFISMELVVAVSKRKLASIDVIGKEQYPFEVVLGKEVGAGLKKVRSQKSW